MSHAALAYAPAPGAAFRRPPSTPARPAAAATPAGGSAARYRDAELASATPGQLVVLLFDKCLLTVRRAQAAFAAGDIAARAGHLCAAIEMVAELRASLDFEAGGDLSPQLAALYSYVLDALAAANRRQDPAPLTSVLHVLGELREAFAGAVAQLAQAQPGAFARRSA